MKDLVDVALKYVGYPAVSAKRNKGNTPDGFSCSGFIEYVLREADIAIPKIPGKNRPISYAVEFFDFFGIPVHYAFRKRGDLVFFSRDGVRPTHLGLCIGRRKMIHSPGEDGEVVSIDEICRYGGEIEFDHECGHEQIYKDNPIGIKRPAILMPERRFHRTLELR